MPIINDEHVARFGLSNKCNELTSNKTQEGLIRLAVIVGTRKEADGTTTQLESPEFYDKLGQIRPEVDDLCSQQHSSFRHGMLIVIDHMDDSVLTDAQRKELKIKIGFEASEHAVRLGLSEKFNELTEKNKKSQDGLQSLAEAICTRTETDGTVTRLDSPAFYDENEQLRPEVQALFAIPGPNFRYGMGIVIDHVGASVLTDAQKEKLKMELGLEASEHVERLGLSKQFNELHAKKRAQEGLSRLAAAVCTEKGEDGKATRLEVPAFYDEFGQLRKEVKSLFRQRDSRFRKGMCIAIDHMGASVLTDADRKMLKMEIGFEPSVHVQHFRLSDKFNELNNINVRDGMSRLAETIRTKTGRGRKVILLEQPEFYDDKGRKRMEVEALFAQQDVDFHIGMGIVIDHVDNRVLTDVQKQELKSELGLEASEHVERLGLSAKFNELKNRKIKDGMRRLAAAICTKKLRNGTVIRLASPAFYENGQLRPEVKAVLAQQERSFRQGMGIVIDRVDGSVLSDAQRKALRVEIGLEANEHVERLGLAEKFNDLEIRGKGALNRLAAAICTKKRRDGTITRLALPAFYEKNGQLRPEVKKVLHCEKQSAFRNGLGVLIDYMDGSVLSDAQKKELKKEFNIPERRRLRRKRDSNVIASHGSGISPALSDEMEVDSDSRSNTPPTLGKRRSGKRRNIEPRRKRAKTLERRTGDASERGSEPMEGVEFPGSSYPIKQEPGSDQNLDAELEELTYLGGSHGVVQYIAGTKGVSWVDNPQGGWDPIAREGVEPSRFFVQQQYQESNGGCSFIIPDRDDPKKVDERFRDPMDVSGQRCDPKVKVHWVTFPGYNPLLCSMAPQALKEVDEQNAYIDTVEKTVIKAIKASFDPNSVSDGALSVLRMDPKEFSPEERRYIDFEKAWGAYIPQKPREWPIAANGSTVLMGGSPLEPITNKDKTDTAHSKLYGPRSADYQVELVRHQGIPSDKVLSKEDFVKNASDEKYEQKPVVLSPYGNPRFKWQFSNTPLKITYSIRAKSNHPRFGELRKHTKDPESKAPLTLVPDPKKPGTIILRSRKKRAGSLDASSPLGEWAWGELEFQKDVSYNDALVGGTIIDGQMGISDRAGKFYVEPFAIIAMDYKHLTKISETMERRLGKKPTRLQFFLNYGPYYLERAKDMRPIQSIQLKREGSSSEELPRSSASSENHPAQAADIVREIGNMTLDDAGARFTEILSSRPHLGEHIKNVFKNVDADDDVIMLEPVFDAVVAKGATLRQSPLRTPAASAGNHSGGRPFADVRYPLLPPRKPSRDRDRSARTR